MLNKIIDGEEGEFNKLFYMYKEKVYRIAKSILHDEGYAEDVTQEVFIIVYKKIYTLKNVEKFDTWLYRIVVNSCNSHFRKNKLSVMSQIEELSEVIPDDHCLQPEERVIQSEINKDITQLVMQLSEKLRNCVILFYFSDCSIAEISEILECSEGTVKSRLFKAKKIIERKLKIRASEGVNLYGYR